MLVGKYSNLLSVVALDDVAKPPTLAGGPILESIRTARSRPEWLGLHDRCVFFFIC